MSPFFLAAIFPDPNLSTAEVKGKWAVERYSAIALRVNPHVEPCVLSLQRSHEVQ